MPRTAVDPAAGAEIEHALALGEVRDAAAAIVVVSVAAIAVLQIRAHTKLDAVA